MRPAERNTPRQPNRAPSADPVRVEPRQSTPNRSSPAPRTSTPRSTNAPDYTKRREGMADPLSVNKLRGAQQPPSIKTGAAARPVIRNVGTNMVGGGVSATPLNPIANASLVAVGASSGGVDVGVVITDGPAVVPVAAPAYVCAYDTFCYSKKSCNSWNPWCKPWGWNCDDNFSFSFSFSSGCSSFGYSSCGWGWNDWCTPCYTPVYVCSSYYTYRPWCWDSVYYGPVYHPTWCSPWWKRCGYYTPVVYYVDEPAVVYTSPTVVYSTPTYVAPAPTLSETWSRLSSGLDRDALEGFAALMQQADAEGLGPGLSTVGYALANAAMGYHESAAAALRSAVRRDPQMLRSVPVDANLATRLHDLIEIYKQRTARTDQQLDALFMIASLHTMLYEDAAAFYAVNQAKSQGDADDSTQLLHAMLSETLSQDLYR